MGDLIGNNWLDRVTTALWTPWQGATSPGAKFGRTIGSAGLAIVTLGAPHLILGSLELGQIAGRALFGRVKPQQNTQKPKATVLPSDDPQKMEPKPDVEAYVPLKSNPAPSPQAAGTTTTIDPTQRIMEINRKKEELIRDIDQIREKLENAYKVNNALVIDNLNPIIRVKEEELDRLDQELNQLKP